MLTIPELTDARDALRQAESLAAHVHGVFLSAGYIQGARILGDVLGLLADEVAALRQLQRSRSSALSLQRGDNTAMRRLLQTVKRTLARIRQVPLRLAWGITVHKSQGMSLDTAVMDLSGAFEGLMPFFAVSSTRPLVR